MSQNGKKVTFGTKPAQTSLKSMDAWVDQKEEKKTSRLTLDIPLALHREIKSQCAQRGVKMIEEITELLEEKYLGKKSD